MTAAAAQTDGQERPVGIGAALTIDDVVAIAEGRARAELDPAARRAMLRSREVARRALAVGEPVYGLTTGVGALKRHAVTEQHGFNRLMILDHCVGHGPLAPEDVVRATMAVRAHALALAGTGVHPRVVEALTATLNADCLPELHLVGSVGQGDLSPLAEIARWLIGEGPESDRLREAGLTPIRLGPGEALAFIGSNAFAIGFAALGVARAAAALWALELSAALSFEAFDANLSAIDPAVAQVRPHDGTRHVITRLRCDLAAGALLDGRRAPRNLQDPLCFRVTPQTIGAAHHGLAEARRIVEIELGSRSENPVILPDQDRTLANGNFDSTPLTIALDYARLGLAQAATIAGERILKLLDPRFSGLPAALRDDPDGTEDGIGVAGHGAAAVAAEIRLLAAPVSLELSTSALTEGIEDRVSHAPAAARRLHEMADWMIRLAAIELGCASQAVDLRGIAGDLGTGTTAAHRQVRRSIPYLTAGTRTPADHAPLIAWLTGMRT
jgi:histidine ammonia-lyase